MSETRVEYRIAADENIPPTIPRREAIAEVEGPWRFDLRRPRAHLIDHALGTVASGVLFRDGAIALRWQGEHKSTAFYVAMRDFVAVHVEGHERTEIRWLDPEPTDAFNRGASECLQDSYENCPFASIGGLESRGAPKVPSYIDDASEAEWLRGYLRSAQAMYGDDWRTCSFGWAPAMTIGGGQ